MKKARKTGFAGHPVHQSGDRPDPECDYYYQGEVMGAILCSPDVEAWCKDGPV
jgi:hypothetical protein